MRSRHVLRDALFLSLPLVVLIASLVGSALISFYNGEILNFQGYLAEGFQGMGLRETLRRAAAPLFRLQESSPYLDDKAPWQDPTMRVFDLRVKGSALDALDRALTASGKVWHKARLVEPEGEVAVDVHYRGQLLSSFFWPQKSWRIKTPKDHMIEGYRVLNLSPLQHRTHAYLLGFIAGQAEVPAPRSRIARLFLNRRDQGLYLQEEAIDESLLRRWDVMPGDVFYGELYPPEEPKSSAAELFWNPYLWEKNDRNNRYPAEYRPYLSELLDHVSDDSPASFDRLYRLMDVDRLVEYYAVLSFGGDQHVDYRHNHKLYFNPTSGKFQPILWDPVFRIQGKEAVETTANRLFEKLARDPRFLDRVQRFTHEKLVQTGMTGRMLAEVDRLKRTYCQRGVSHQGEVETALDVLRASVASRGEELVRLQGMADARFASEPRAGVTLLQVFARSLASLRLTAIELREPADAQLFEDRDGDGQVSPADRELPVSLAGSRLVVASSDALVYVGRDFTASYRPAEGERPEVLAEYTTREYSRPAYLESRYLLRPRAAGTEPQVTGVSLERTVGTGGVDVRRGAPDGFLATETVHPWSMPAPEPARSYRFAGDAAIEKDLVVRETDSFAALPGTRLRLGPGVSIVIHCRVELDGVRLERLDPDRPWGVLALQGPGTSGSILQNCQIGGGSEATVDYIYYSGMLSARLSERLVLRDTLVTGNVAGDDSVHFAKCHDLSIERVRIEGALGDAIDLDLSSGRIVDTYILEPKNDGIDMMTSKVDVERLTVLGASDKGISVGEGSHPEIRDSHLIGCVTGIASKDGSEPLVERTEIRDCKVGVAAYHKNWRYASGGSGRLRDCTLAGNGKDVKLDRGSRMVLERTISDGRFDLPADIAAGAFQNLEPIRVEEKGPKR